MEYGIIAVTAFGASLLTLYSGFGLGTLLLPVLALFFPVAAAVALTAAVHLLNNLFKLAALWKHADTSVALRFGVPALLAAVPGAWALASLDHMPALATYTVMGHDAEITPVKLVVGALMLVFATAELMKLAKKAEISKKALPLGGVLSGFFGGLSGHQGAFRSAFLAHAGLDGKSFVATNAMIAALVDIARLSVYGLSLGVLTDPAHLPMLGTATVAAIVGVIAGIMLLEKITIDLIRKLIAVMLYALGGLICAGIL